MPVAASQPKAARRPLSTFATPSAIPPVAAHTRTSGHENRLLRMLKTASGDLSRRSMLNTARISFVAIVDTTMPTTMVSSFQARRGPTLSITCRTSTSRT